MTNLLLNTIPSYSILGFSGERRYLALLPFSRMRESITSKINEEAK
ncbi:hypothetical protein RI844_19440 [Thalassotalea fonticola]|uniref:Uncharacterized protein n=1 Tax=Thalassotalea fonticola TaxID=3065649 RepID=A0ABZ0GPJ5_9GAMM|nr:hypothetical protein RI844_19440 [Colwelliaceae bacterium S1-1]